MNKKGMTTASGYCHQRGALQLAEIQLLGTKKYTYWWSFGDSTTASSDAPGVPLQLQHTFTNNGMFTAVLGVTYGGYSGTNTIVIRIGPP
jgi:hypothetical protein